MSLTRQQKLREENDRLYKIIDEKIESIGELVMDAERLANALRDFAGDYSSGPKDEVREALAAHEKLVTS